MKRKTIIGKIILAIAYLAITAAMAWTSIQPDQSPAAVIAALIVFIASLTLACLAIDSIFRRPAGA